MSIHEDLRRTTPATGPAVAIIGAGFSGTLLALHLLRRCPAATRIHLIERGRRSFGRGLAYGTPNPSHLLNVPAGRMSAFSDQPGDFVEWLRRQPGGAVAETSFVERRLFGRYVRDLLSQELRRARRRRLTLSRGEATRIEVARDGLALELDHDRRITADIAVLAVGNFPPEAPRIADPGFFATSYYRADPWAPETLAGLPADAPVLLIGTGLTMVDTVISLLDQGHRGPIHALSRRGLLPHRHSGAKSAPLLGEPLPTAITALLGYVRAAVAETENEGGDWRSVVDGLRPAMLDIWQSLDSANRARFVRHLRPWWDIHRHRVPGPVADRIAAAMASGQLTIGAARIADLRLRDGMVDVTVRPRATTAPRHYRVARVINCSGPGCDYDRITDPLVRGLLADGHIRPDPLRLGLDTTPQCALLNAGGEMSRRLYAVGPVTKAVFWEMTAVPDIRRQCEQLASHIATLVAAIERPRLSVTAPVATAPATP